MNKVGEVRRSWSACALFLLFLWVLGTGGTHAFAGYPSPTAYAAGDRSEQWGTARHAVIAPVSSTRALAKGQPHDGAGDPAIVARASGLRLPGAAHAGIAARNAWWPREEARQRFAARAPPFLK